MSSVVDKNTDTGPGGDAILNKTEELIIYYR